MNDAIVVDFAAALDSFYVSYRRIGETVLPPRHPGVRVTVLLARRP